MRKISFKKGNRSGNLLHIESEGMVVNIRVGLTDDQGNEVSRVDILPDDKTRGGDWHADTKNLGIRLIRKADPA